MTSGVVLLSGFRGMLSAACFWAALVLCPAGTLWVDDVRIEPLPRQT
jgi:hypothetical protein